MELVAVAEVHREAEVHQEAVEALVTGVDEVVDGEVSAEEVAAALVVGAVRQEEAEGEEDAASKQLYDERKSLQRRMGNGVQEFKSGYGCCGGCGKISTHLPFFFFSNPARAAGYGKRFRFCKKTRHSGGMQKHSHRTPAVGRLYFFSALYPRILCCSFL